MYDWRGKFGFVNPSIIDTILLEFYRILPEGVLVTPVDLKIQHFSFSEFLTVYGKIEEAVNVLEEEEVQAIIVGGTPPITKLGFEADKSIIERIENLTGKPASTAPTAEVEAMRFLGLKKIAMITPFDETLNQHLGAYYKYCGFEVVVAKGLGIVKHADLTKVPFTTAYMWAKEAYCSVNGAVDGIFFACPRWPTVQSIEPLENDLGISVVTSAQAVVWKALNMLKVRKVRPGFGKLFSGFESTLGFQGVP